MQHYSVLSLDLLFKDLSRKRETSQFLIDCEGVSYCFLKNSQLLMSILHKIRDIYNIRDDVLSVLICFRTNISLLRDRFTKTFKSELFCCLHVLPFVK